ncbi:TrkH family potassium uptake protein [candidate division NPL-UPA2 bacterium]|nr:TrkH family potassium uptake protein [candidate division NPL-UPA2 bacterium]
MSPLKSKYSSIISYLGLLTTGLGVILLLPLLSLLFWPEEMSHLGSFLIPAIFSILAGLCLWRVFRPRGESPPLTTPDAALMVTVIWLIAVILGSLPFVLSKILSPLDAIFEAMSGWTTTGLTMVTDLDNTPHILLLWRSLMQFVGGAGLAVIMLSAIIGSLGPGVYEAEARTDHLVPHIMHTARMIIKIYLAYYVLGVVLYLMAGMDPFDAICHAMSGLATGGFSTKSENIAYWQSIRVEMVSLVLMLLGTTNFATHHALISSRGKKGLRDAEIKLMAWLIILIVPLVTFGLFRAGSGGSFRNGLFQVVSALSGTGYSTTALSQWGQFPLFLIIILMIIGGGTGSTAGGIKLYRIVIIIKSIWWWIKKQFYPSSAVIQRTIWRRGERLEIQDKHIQAVAGFIGLYLLTYLIGVTIFLGSGFSLTESMFEFASAMGTVGLSLGITRPDMPIACKVAQILGMWLGRLEFIAIFHAFIRIGRDFKHSKA